MSAAERDLDEAIALKRARRPSREVDFVADQDERHHGRKCSRRGSFVTKWLRVVVQPEHAVRPLELSARAADAFLLDRVGAVVHPRGIDDVQRQPVDLDVLAQQVPRRAGNRRDDGGVVAGKGVQQARLAGVGGASDDYPGAVAQQAPLARRSDESLEPAGHVGDVRKQRAIAKEVDVVVGEIDRGLDEGAQAGELLRYRADPAGEFTL